MKCSWGNLQIETRLSEAEAPWLGPGLAPALRFLPEEDYKGSRLPTGLTCVPGVPGVTPPVRTTPPGYSQVCRYFRRMWH